MDYQLDIAGGIQRHLFKSFFSISLPWSSHSIEWFCQLTERIQKTLTVMFYIGLPMLNNDDTQMWVKTLICFGPQQYLGHCIERGNALCVTLSVLTAKHMGELQKSFILRDMSLRTNRLIQDYCPLIKVMTTCFTSI